MLRYTWTYFCRQILDTFLLALPEILNDGSKVRRHIHNPVKHLKCFFCENIQWLRAVHHFCKKLHLSCLTVLWIHLWGSPYFLRRQLGREHKEVEIFIFHKLQKIYFQINSKPTSGQFSHFIPPENRKIKIFWCF